MSPPRSTPLFVAYPLHLFLPPPQGDQRTHSHVVALRAVTSSDGMTADWYAFQPEFLRTVSSRICNKVRCFSFHHLDR